MEVNLTLVVATGVLVACGVYLLLERSLTRVLVGLVLVGNGVNLALLAAGGPAGEAPFWGAADPDDMADPLPQALVLTAIVITFGMTALTVILSLRSFLETGSDQVDGHADHDAEDGA